jgi:antitoxin ParD1/3/4
MTSRSNNMNVSLGSKWDRFVDAKVKSGDFQTASEVLREGLRLLEEKDLLKRISFSSLTELRERLFEGIASLDNGKGIDGEEAFRQLRQRSKKRQGRA